LLTYTTFCDNLASQGIDKGIIERLIEEYKIAKKQFFLEKHELSILHSAKFADVALAIVKNAMKRQVVDIDRIESKKLSDEIIGYPKKTPEEVILTLAIPRVAESIQTIRNKKDVAHVKSIDPDSTDSDYCITSCNWILCQFVLILSKANVNETKNFTDSLMKKKIPIIEEFDDGSVVILNLHLTKQEEILLFLYHYYPERQTNEKLINLLRTKNNFYSYLSSLESGRLIHRAEKGITLTRLGIKQVEDNILPKIDS
jgi:hypothetical protein